MSLNLTAQTVQWHPSYTFRHGLASSPIHPLSSPPNIGWLLFITIKQRPSKAKAPPSLYYLMPFILPPKCMNQQQRAQAQRLATCVWWWGAAARWFGGTTALPTERERAKPLGVGWQWLMLVGCCVCCVCCVLFVVCFMVVFCVLRHCYHQICWLWYQTNKFTLLVTPLTVPVRVSVLVL